MQTPKKLRFLATLADKPILLNDNFIEAAARRLHGIVGRATTSTRGRFLPRISLAVGAEERGRAELLFEVRSPRKAWLNAAV